MTGPTMARPKSVLVGAARGTLGLTREKFGELRHLSKRTVGRMETGGSSASPDELFLLARHVHPHDPKLADELALAGGSTLDRIGIAPLAAPPPAIPGHALVDAVVCAAADALQVVPETVRCAVLAAFRRAREVRMTVEDVEKALDQEKGPGETLAARPAKSARKPSR